MSGEFLIISGEGQAYGKDDAEARLCETGWRKVERRPLGGPNSVICDLIGLTGAVGVPA